MNISSTKLCCKTFDSGTHINITLRPMQPLNIEYASHYMQVNVTSQKIPFRNKLEEHGKVLQSVPQA